MADFLQPTVLPTLHHLSSPHGAVRDEDLQRWSSERPVVVLLPALYAECERPALPRILEEISEVAYVSEVVLTMNQMRAAECDRALAFVRRYLRGKKAWILWNDGPECGAIWKGFEELGAPPYLAGKGANIWMGLAWLHARGHEGAVVSHDTDILNYTRSLLWKLCAPVIHPEMNYHFVKGYYTRVSERLYGRVTRLLFFPLIQAFADVLGKQPLIEHYQAFRYPLSGEFAGDMKALRQFELPSGWGLEVAMLAEVQRQLEVEQMCQVDLGFHYEHKHRRMEPGGPVAEPGLIAAAMEVAQCLVFQLLRDADLPGAGALLKVVIPRYRKRALEWVRRYQHVSLMNALEYDQAAESAAVEGFADALDGLVDRYAHGLWAVPGLRPGAADLLAHSDSLKTELAGIGISV